MSHYLNLRFNQVLNQSGTLSTTFNLDGLSAPFFNESECVFDCRFYSHMIGPIWHIGYQQGPFDSSSDRAEMNHYFLQSNGQSGFVTQSRHTQGIAYQQNIDSCLIQTAGKRIVIGRETSNGFLLGFLFEQLGDCYLF